MSIYSATEGEGGLLHLNSCAKSTNVFLVWLIPDLRLTSSRPEQWVQGDVAIVCRSTAFCLTFLAQDT
jgi:hypothetical protein